MRAAGGAAWPDGAPYALCLTHDVDRVRKYMYHYFWHGLRGGGSGLRRQAAMLVDRLKGQRHYWNFERIMALEADYGVRSTFLFLNEKARGLSPKFWGRYDIKAPELRSVMRELVRGGWEVGLHGSYYSFDDPELLRHEKMTLEDIMGEAVRSTRQHFLNLAAPRTWLIQRSLGLDVDSTVGYARRPWDDWSRVVPYYEPASGILELPITLMDTIGLARPENRFACHAALEQVKSRGGLIVLDWHQRTFTPNDWPDAVSFYRETIEQSLADGAWVATMAAVADHWKATVHTAG
jgi:peptidoglycan/xylan/chitin deacetylase (PgdA/CDA1 family)